MAGVGAGSGSPRLVRVVDVAGLAPSLGEWGIAGGRPVVVLVGGAGGMDEHEVDDLSVVLREVVFPVLGDRGVVVDGGTDSGVMRAAGRARVDAGPGGGLLVGVAAEGTVAAPEGTSTGDDAPAVEAGHTHVVLVPGTAWGDESAWIARVAAAIAEDGPSVTVLANGGAISGGDVEMSLAEGRPVIVLAGAGRLSDEVASMLGDTKTSSQAARIARSDLTTVVSVHDVEAVRSAVTAALRRPEEPS